MKNRYLQPVIQPLAFAADKMAFLSGPRQVGKTTLARALLSQRGAGTYYNWDQVEFRRTWAKTPSSILDVYPRPTDRRPLVVLDELHKAPRWKQTLKGLYDTRATPLDLLVTGSARLTVYQRGGDSLMGRYTHFRLHPLSVAELLDQPPIAPADFQCRWQAGEFPENAAATDCLDDLLRWSGFPEPLLARNDRRARIWRRNREEQVLREDLRDLTRVLDLGKVQTLVALLPERVGGLFSRNSLREDLAVSFETVDRWIAGLKELYYVFEIRPYSRNITRSLKKEGKLYLWDYAALDDPAARFENCVASHLLKACHYWTDTGEGTFTLHLLRDRAGHEIDFLIARDGRPWLPVEAKLTSQQPERSWNKFLSSLDCGWGLQLVADPDAAPRLHRVGHARVVTAAAARVLPWLV